MKPASVHTTSPTICVRSVPQRGALDADLADGVVQLGQRKNVGDGSDDLGRGVL
jgi:hypothetical protein